MREKQVEEEKFVGVDLPFSILKQSDKASFMLIASCVMDILAPLLVSNLFWDQQMRNL